jgi:hypothetical protein
MSKRAQWEDMWDKQRDEDAAKEPREVSVPPKYKQVDFIRHGYWKQRGKLDVPKERFISYPMASPDGDDSMLMGWAGWDHREQAHALMTLIEERSTRDGWGVDKLQPLIAGLTEVMPWVRQWHAEVDPKYGTRPAYAYEAYLEDQCIKYSLSDEDLRNWSAPAPSRQRRRTGGRTIPTADDPEQSVLSEQDEGTT